MYQNRGHWSIDQLIDWWINWLINWLIDQLNVHMHVCMYAQGHVLLNCARKTKTNLQLLLTTPPINTAINCYMPKPWNLQQSCLLFHALCGILTCPWMGSHTQHHCLIRKMAHRPLLDDLLPKQEVQLRKKIEQKKLLLDVGIQGVFFCNSRQVKLFYF